MASGNKKKPSGLDDYIGISSQKKSEKRESLEKEKVISVSHKKPPVTMASQLSKQELCEDDD